VRSRLQQILRVCERGKNEREKRKKKKEKREKRVVGVRNRPVDAANGLCWL